MKAIRRPLKKTFVLVTALLFLCLFSKVQTAQAENVHSLYWKATVNTTVQVRSLGTGKKVKLKKGTSVTVTFRRISQGSSSTVLLPGNKGKAKVANKYLTYRKALVTAPDYSKKTKAAFVKKYSSQTKYLLWASLDKQRVTVFKGKKGSWKVVKVFRFSSGDVAHPTGISTNYTIKRKAWFYSAMYYVTWFSGNAFHSWPIGYTNESTHLGKQVASHGCLRLSTQDAKWIYNNIPVGTRCIVY